MTTKENNVEKAIKEAIKEAIKKAEVLIKENKNIKKSLNHLIANPEYTKEDVIGTYGLGSMFREHWTELHLETEIYFIQPLSLVLAGLPEDEFTTFKDKIFDPKNLFFREAQIIG